MFRLPLKLLLLMVSFFPLITLAADKHGCWEPMNSCLKAEAKWSNHNEGKLLVRYTNHCADRVLVKACNEYQSGNEDCGLFGLNDSSSNTWATSKASGSYMFQFTGSLKAQNDGICSQTKNQKKQTRHSMTYTKP